MSSERPRLSFDVQAFIANVGVPAAILFLSISQLVPRLDKGLESQARIEGALTVVASQCVPKSP